MSKIVIDDAMVERGARAAWGKNLDQVFRYETATPRETIRVALEAALNPKRTPAARATGFPASIVVTDEMTRAGLSAWLACPGELAPVVDVYRAMRAREIEEQKPDHIADDGKLGARIDVRRDEPSIAGRYVHWREGEPKPGAVLRCHRRKGEPA